MSIFRVCKFSFIKQEIYSVVIESNKFSTDKNETLKKLKWKLSDSLKNFSNLGYIYYFAQPCL